MIDTLVVIATHRGAERVRRFLAAVPQLYPIHVVDTGSPPETCRELIKLGGTITVDRTPYKGYDTGAYLWAYWTRAAKNYLFLQDSLIPTRPDYVEPFQQAMPRTGGAVAWSGFSMCWDSQAQCDAIKFMYGHEVPEIGIFGPIFYTSREALDKLSDRGLLPMPPNSKLMAQGCERAWAIGYHRAGMRVALLHREHDRDAMSSGRFKVFRKEFGART